MTIAHELLRVARLLCHRVAAVTTHQLNQLNTDRQTLSELYTAADRWLKRLEMISTPEDTVKIVRNAHAQLDQLIKRAMDTQKTLSDIGNELSHQQDYMRRTAPRHAATSPKELMRVTRNVQDSDDAIAVAKTLSRQHGGAWIILVQPFSTPGDAVDFVQFKNPSSVPDHYFDLVHGKIFMDGKERTFTHAAIIREQNRGLGAD